MMSLSQRKSGKAWRRFQTAVKPAVGGYTRAKPTAGASARDLAKPAAKSPAAKSPAAKSPDLFYAGYDDLARDVKLLALKLPAGCDGVAGVPNSGRLPARLLSEAAGLPLYDLTNVPTGVKSLVVLEDATETLRFKAFYAHLAKGRRVLWAAVYACGPALRDLDVYAVEAAKPRVFAWNVHKHHKYTHTFLFDIDGIVCPDPIGDECREPGYSKFIASAPPLLPPLSKSGTLTNVKPAMGTFVTGRKVAYKALTETWLRRHFSSWRGLVMRPDNTESGSQAIAAFKSGVYAKSDAPLFIESSEKQARMIHEATGKPVACPQRGFGTRGSGQRANDKIIYTVSTGTYAQATAPRFDVPEGWDYVRLTDKDCPAHLSPKQKAAWAKANGPHIFSRYSESLCIDDDMTVLQSPDKLFAGHAFAFTARTPFLYKGVRQPGDSMTWSMDLDNTAELRKAATSTQCEAEKMRYLAAGFTDSKDWRTGIIYRKHTADVIKVCDKWWEWYQQSETQRDQPSLAIACQQLGYTPATVPADEHVKYFKHDYKKANRDGVKYYVGKSGRTLLYTVSTGPYSQQTIAPHTLPDDWDFVRLTDTDCPPGLSDKQKASWAKINGLNIFPDYDRILYLDDDIALHKDPTAAFGTANLMLAKRAALSTWHADLKASHSKRAASTAELCNAERDRYTRLGFKDSATYLGGLIWRVRCDEALKLCDTWWKWYQQSETQRDQPSLAIACQQLGYTPATLDELTWYKFCTHDTRKADRDGTRYKATTTPPPLIAKPRDMSKPLLAGNKKLIYTISTGAYATVAPEQFEIPEGWDYIRVTDNDCPYYLSPKQKAAWAKINAPRLFGQYACSLCIDDDITILQDPSPAFCQYEWTAMSRKHPATLAEDLVAIVKARRAVTQDKVDAEWERYHAAGIDKNGPVWISNVMFRQHTDRIRRVCDEWWWWYTQSETQRDQPSMCAAIQLTGIAPHGLREKEDLAGYTRHNMRKADNAGVRIKLPVGAKR